MAQGVIPLNDSAVFSQQPVQATGGTTTATLATRAENRLDLVADFGADPTGATDITSVLQTAINSGKPIFVPDGTFLWNGTVSDPGAVPVNISCSSPATTTFNLSGLLDISQTGNYTIPLTIKNCNFNFSGAGQISISGTTAAPTVPLNGILFENDNFNIGSGYTGSGPALNFAWVPIGSIINNTAFIDVSGTGILENFIGMSGVEMNWEFSNNQFWDTINGSNATNVTTGLFLNGENVAGIGNSIQGIRISDDMFVGFSKNIYIGSYVNTVQITNTMLDQAYYPLYISGTSINDIRITNSYLATSAAANSAAASVYVGAASNVKIAHNTVVPYNAGNYSIDLSAAAPNNVTLLDNNNELYINNPNNVVLPPIYTFNPVSASNVINGQIVTQASTSLSPGQAGSDVFFNGTAAATITLPNSVYFNTTFSGLFFLNNIGSAPLTIATVASDNNRIINPNGGLGGTFVLNPGQSTIAYSNPGMPGWNGFYSTVLPALEVNNVILGTTPAVITLATNPPVSGTVYQWAGPGTLELSIPVTFNQTSTAAATATLDIGPTTTPTTAMDRATEPAALAIGEIYTLKASIPAGWYWSITGTNVTIGTAAAIVH